MRTAKWLLALALVAAACSSSGGTTTTATTPPAPTTTATPATTAPAPSTTATTTATAPADDRTFQVDTTGVRPRRVVLEEGATVVRFVNGSDRDFDVDFQGGELFDFELLAGETATLEFADQPGAVYSFRVLLGNASFPGTVDATALGSVESLGSVTSWDGALTAGHPFGVTGWAYAGIADGVLAGAEDLGPRFAERRTASRFLEALGGGRDMDTPGLLAVFRPVGGDLDGAGQAAIGAPLPPGCDGPDVEPVTRSGLAGAEALGACGDASFRHGYVAVPDAGGIVEYWAFYLDDEDARVGDTMLDTLRIGDPDAEPSTRAVHVWPAEQGRDEVDGAAVVGLAAGVPDPASAWLGPWNSGTVAFASRDGRPYRIVWADPALAPLEVPAGGAARVDLPPDGAARPYTVVSDTGRGVGEVASYEPAEAEVVENDRFTDLPPLLSVRMPLVERSMWGIGAPWPWLLTSGVPEAAAGSPDISDYFTITGPTFAANLEQLPDPPGETALRLTAELLAGQVDVQVADCERGDPVDGTVAGWDAITYTFTCTGELAEVTASMAWPRLPADGALIVITAVADDEDRWHVEQALGTLTIADDAVQLLADAVADG